MPVGEHALAMKNNGVSREAQLPNALSCVSADSQAD